MKISFKHLFLLVLFPLMGLHFVSCIRDTGCPDPPATVTVDLPHYLKDKIPYTGKDTLMFIRKTDGDTHTFIGQGLKRGYDLLPRDGGDEECLSSRGSASMEYVKYTFVSSTFPSSIVLHMYYVEYPVGKNVSVRFNNKLYKRPSSVFTPFAKDSFKVGSRMYYDVATIADDLDPLSQEYFTLFNATYGILKFRFATGEEWELLPKP
ncbi:MAG: hypothetical protein V4590_15060 [Bacteroidota bacterium]